MKQRYIKKNNVVKFKRLTLILLTLLVGGNRAWAWAPSSAGTYYLRSTGTGNNFNVYTGPGGTGTVLETNQAQLNGFKITGGTYTLVFENTKTIIMNGQIFISAAANTDAHLIMELGTGATANPTLKITGVSRQSGSTQDVAFFIDNIANTERNKHTITVQGKNPSAGSLENISNYVYDFNNNFVIDGDGPVMTAIDNGTSTPQMKVTTAGKSKSYGLFRIQEGTLTMKNVTVQNFATTWGNGGVIQVYTNQNNAKALADIDHCHFKSIASKNEIVLKVQSDRTYNDQPTSGPNAGLNVGLRDAKFKNCKIEYTFGCNTATYSTLNSGHTQTIDTQNGTFRSVGKNSVTISLENCHLTNNYGCPVRWHGSRSKDKLIVNHCKIENNYTLTGTNVNGGGGLLLKGPAQISQCTIQKNRTNGDGGGIYLSTYTDFGNGTQDLVPDHSILELDGQTLIDNNTAAGNGGGVAINGLEMNNTTGVPSPNGPNYIWYNPDGEPFKLRFVLGGATISNNKALGGDGGGVWINRNNRVTYFKLECELDKGTISTNQCSHNGGGVAIITTSTFSNPTTMPNTVVPQDVTVTVGKAGETANKISIENNTAATYGGGIYVEAYPIPYNGVTSEVNTTVYDYSEIKENTGTSHGGGLYVKRGTVNVTQSGSKQPLIQGNKANTNHGGGIYLDEGTINISGGILDGNKATAHGGGIYNNNGDINLSNGSEIKDNEAGTYNSGTYGNGGGIYTQSGAVSVSNSTVKGNKCQKLGGGIYTRTGNITLVNATIGGDKNANEGNQTVHTEGDGGGIYTQNGAVVMTGSAVQGNTAKRNGGGVYVANNSVTMLSCAIGGSEAKYGNTATTGSGGGIYVGNGAVLINANETGVGNPSDISYNTAQVHGGGMYVEDGRVVAFGSFTESAYYPITITYNKANAGSGGGIFCMGNGATTYFDIRLRRVIVSHNEANGTASTSSTINLGCGGGMYLDQGKISVNCGDIHHNEAKVSGGGIYTREGDIDINGTQDEHTATQITNNTAGLNGGGVNTHSGTVTILGNSPSQRINISGNTATTGSGGGIFCYGTDVNTKYITLLHADLNDNHAAQGGGTQTVLSTVVSGRGGGMYLQKGIIDVTDVKIQQNTAKLNGGGINNHEGNIDVNGCLIGGGAGLGNMAGYDSSTGQQNTEGSGGGIYTNAGDIDIEDYVETTGGITRIESKITHNTAALNGGGADTHSGTITVNGAQRGDQIEISHNTAKKGGGLYANAGTIYTYNALIDNNTATDNGGGINNHAGDIFIYGGSLSNNTATNGRGGGVYTDVGDIDIMHFPYDDDHQDTIHGTKIYNNIARLNGGAINNHTGLVDVRYATIRNNTSTLGNGGAIYCEGPHANTTGKTIRLLRSILDHNKTRGADGTATDPTGRGGGIYLKYGSIFAQGSIIKRNSANINGGGVDNHEGDIRLYGCLVDKNEAVEGSGGGIYTLHGDITTGPCYLYKATQITNNTAARNGGGINNGDLSVSSADKGNIYLNGDHILNNTALQGNGGGIYIADGQIDMFGGKIENNKALEGDGGGVWSGGGEFNIQKREGKPVIEVIDITPSTTTAGQYVVHYHLMHAGTSATSTHEHGFWYGTESDETGTKVQYTNSGLTPGCYKDGACLLSSLAEATTYWVKAYAINDQGETVSDKAWFTTLSSSKPTVYTGGSADVTKNSATLNGKWIDKGSSNITEVGFVYSLTNPNPTIGTTECYTVSSTDIDGKFFTLPLTGLTAEKTYYFRAYAKNGNATNNTGYGDVATFTTLKNTPDMGTGTVVLTTTTDYTTTPFTNTITASFTMPPGTNFTNSGAPNYITAYGFVWSTDDDPELYSDHTIPGTLTSGTTFTATYVGARGGLTVYVRAYASSNADEPAAMNITNYSISTPTQTITPSTDGTPVVRATNIKDITQHSAEIYGKLIDKGTSAITQYGIVWSATNTEPTLESNDGINKVEGSLENGAEFTLAMSNLTAGKTYYLRTFATNSKGTAYSNNFSFTALNVTRPQVTINEVTDITENSANVQCSFTDGGDEVTDWGVKYSTNSDMSGAIDVKKPGTTLSGNTFTAALPKTGEDALAAYTTYYVQAYATNSAGTHTCRAITFMTADNAIPTVDQLALSSINLPTGGSNESTISYQVTPATGTTVKTHGVVWSTLQNPKRQESEVTNTHFEEATDQSVTSATTSTKTRTQAYPNMKYYVRAYASKEDPDANNTLANIVYSNEISFVTLPVVATPEGDDAVSNLTNNSATLKGTIVSRDTEGHLQYNMRGVCWSTSANPTRTGTNYAEQTITMTSGSSVNYSVDATNLTAGTTYYYRAYYYRNSDNAITYGEERTFTTKAYSLTIVASPTEGGTVDKTLVGLNEGETCEVTATANAGYTFNHWTYSGGGTSASISEPTTTNPTTFTMGNPGADATLTANFTPNSYNLSVEVEPTEAGNVTVNGAAYSDPVSVTYNTTTVTLEATPATDYEFLNWTVNGNVVSSANPYTFTYNIAGDATFVANFEPTRGSKNGSQTSRLQEGQQTGRKQARPRDIYPAPAREPWLWEEDDLYGNEMISEDFGNDYGTISALQGIPETDTLPQAADDTLAQLREQLSRAEVEPQDIPLIQYNRAYEGKGGGIYMENNDPANPTKLVFTGGDADNVGKIVYNYAKEAGGGIYIDKEAYMQMKGHCEVNANWVPAGKLGGGIYLAGRLYVGDKRNDGTNAHALKVNKNFAVDVDDVTVDKPTRITNLCASITQAEKTTLRNNIMLPRNTYDYGITANSDGDDQSTVITLLSDISAKDGDDNPYTQLGFSVISGFCPVIATSTAFSGHYMNQGETYETWPFNKYNADGTAISPEPTNYYEKWLSDLMPQGDGGIGALTDEGAIFEDSETYIAIHTDRNNQPFRAKYIYLWGSWTNPAVSEDPERNTGPEGNEDQSMVGTGKHYKIETETVNGKKITHWEIYSEEGLSWFSSYVNGLNAFTPGNHSASNPDPKHKDHEWEADKNPCATAKLMADLDMKAHLWVPIGSVSRFNGAAALTSSDPNSTIYTDDGNHTFKGEFDGQGHTIRGLDGRFLTGIQKYGLFGHLDGAAKVKNIFIDDSQFITDKTSTQYAIGGVSGVVSGNAVLSASEARTRIDITTSGDNTFAGGIAGKIESGGTVHSAIGLPEITGTSQYMGGLVGQNLGNLYNSFANPKFPNATTAPYYVMPAGHYIGGLVGENGGTVENCYSRLQGDEPTSNGTAIVFGWLAGTNTTSGKINFSYAPQGKTTYIKGTNVGTLGGQANYSPTVLKSGKYGFKHRDQQMYKPDQTTLIEEGYSTYITEHTNNNFVGGLQIALNAWVNYKNETTKTYHPWMRPMATTINDDLPIHMFQVWTENGGGGGGGSKEMVASSLYNAVGSKDKVYLEYDNDANALLAEYVALETATYPTPAIYLYEANTTTPEPNITVSNTSGVANPNVMFAINEDVGIKVSGAAAEATGLKARVGTVLRNDRGGDADETTDPNWHLFSSAINEVPIGIVYHYDTDPDWVSKILDEPYHPDNIWSSHAEFDPPKTTWAPGANAGYFPTNTPYGSWRGAGYNDTDNLNDDGVGGFYDFYEYNEEYYHWINYKRNSYDGKSDHWHLDHDGQPKKNHFNIPLQNDETFVSGKGYLVALSSESMMMADGMLNVGEKTTTVTRSSYNTHSPNLSGYDQEWRSLALVGNPYQSYLDFGEFEKTNRETLDQPTFAVRDDDDYSYKFYTAGGSKNSAAADNLIHPHQGFFIKLKPNMATTFPDVITESITFNEGMRKAGKSLSPFRGGLDYPLVNLFCTDENGKGDYTTVEIGRPDEGGGEKMKNLHIGDGLIYARWNDTDYQTLFTPAGVSTVPVRFRPSEDGTYTITWTMENGQFNYVHLIDNITGADVDCLTATEYKFEGNKDDYLSRFKLVFDCVGVEENEDPDPEGLKPFAFQFGEELVVNGNGYVEMFDVTGRRLMTGRANGGQSSFGIPKVAAGVYVLRLTDNGKSRVQKIVIERN